MHTCHHRNNVYMRECANICIRAHEEYKKHNDYTSKHSEAEGSSDMLAQHVKYPRTTAHKA